MLSQEKTKNSPMNKTDEFNKKQQIADHTALYKTYEKSRDIYAKVIYSLKGTRRAYQGATSGAHHLEVNFI